MARHPARTVLLPIACPVVWVDSKRIWHEFKRECVLMLIAQSSVTVLQISRQDALYMWIHLHSPNHPLAVGYAFSCCETLQLKAPSHSQPSQHLMDVRSARCATWQAVTLLSPQCTHKSAPCTAQHTSTAASASPSRPSARYNAN
eukprot:15573-Heterococcus_DN1.PRE.1